MDLYLEEKETQLKVELQGILEREWETGLHQESSNKELQRDLNLRIRCMESSRLTMEVGCFSKEDLRWTHHD